MPRHLLISGPDLYISKWSKYYYVRIPNAGCLADIIIFLSSLPELNSIKSSLLLSVEEENFSSAFSKPGPGFSFSAVSICSGIDEA